MRILRKINVRVKERYYTEICSASVFVLALHMCTLQWFSIKTCIVPFYFEKYCKNSYNHQSTIMPSKKKISCLYLDLYVIFNRLTLLESSNITNPLQTFICSNHPMIIPISWVMNCPKIWEELSLVRSLRLVTTKAI